MPFAASRWHRWWSVDVRYIDEHQLGTRTPAYVISVLDNFSRAILASAISARQDLTAYLVVLRVAVERYGVPEGLVSDGGGIFKATSALEIYRVLGIRKKQIVCGQPWQNYAETMFSVMRRMADHDFADAATWEDLAAVHARFVRDYNHQPHAAHRAHRADRRSPLAVPAAAGGDRVGGGPAARSLPTAPSAPERREAGAAVRARAGSVDRLAATDAPHHASPEEGVRIATASVADRPARPRRAASRQAAGVAGLAGAPDTTVSR